VRWTVVLLAGFGCFAPSAQPGAPCPSGVCPEGLICSSTTATCELRASDASIGSDDAPTDPSTDGAIDAPPDAATMAMLVQQTTNYATSAAMLSATLATTPASGSVLVMIGATPSGGLTSVTGAGATWTRATQSLMNSNVEIWFGVTNGSSATVTVARTNNVAPMWLAVSEWSGLSTTSTVDKAASTYGSGNPVSAGSIQTANARDVIIFAATAYTPNTYGVPSPGTWTPMTGIAGQTNTQSAWYRVESATGTFAPQVTQTGGFWEAAIVALRIAP
jgi:hypothetical protein